MVKGRLKPGTAPNGWKNRIVGSGVQAADQFIASPDNWRKHPSAQEDALVAVLSRVGWVQEVIVSRRSGHVIDGHLRVLAALKRGDKTPVPYKEVDVSESEEALILSTMDPLSAMAIPDQPKLDELLALLPEDFAGVAQLVFADPPEGRTVQFTATEKHQIVVECPDADAAAQLLARLTAEGFKCRGKS